MIGIVASSITAAVEADGEVVPPTPNKRFWRAFINSVQSDSGADYSLLEFRINEQDQTDPVEALTAASASSHYAPEALTADKAFDNSGSSRWASDFSGTWPQWIQYDFGPNANKNITSVYIDSWSVSRSPRNWKVQWSPDGATWYTAYENTAEPPGIATYVYFGG